MLPIKTITLDTLINFLKAAENDIWDKLDAISIDIKMLIGIDRRK